MGRQPSVLIIARHGIRLDQTNKDWQDNADRPWDSPLSYGGWIQCQNLGARIASELQNLDASQSNNGANKENTSANQRPRKRRKITIHSSPYLRCIQTSIGIAAGLHYPQDVPRMRPIPTPFQRSSLSKPPMLVDEPTSPPIESTSDPTSGAPPGATTSRAGNAVTDLKIDAWLGEWLSSGYFEKSAPPPSSDVLIKNAKEALKKPPEEIKGADIAKTTPEFEEVASPDQFSEIKDGRDVNNMPVHEKTGLRAMAAKGHSMTRRSRTVSLNTGPNNGTATSSLTGATSNLSISGSEPTGRRPRSTTYSPPIPMYSIAPQDTIPIGFVAHARDSCIDTDFEWDSQRPPLEWGDGGKYEEEWSTMHRRFRNGLQGLLSYYESQYPDDLEDEGTEEDEDLVVILVTHQAGCNALIRLVTGAPALHDVGTASLTLAVRKPGLIRKVSTQSSVSPRRGSLDLGLSDDFDMKIIASVEHLRAGSNPLGLNSPRLAMSPAFASRRMVGAESLEGFSIGDPLTWRSSSQSTLGRSSTIRGHVSQGSFSADSLGGAGLWSLNHARTSSVSSDTSLDPRSPPHNTPKTSTTNVSNRIILEDEAIEDWAASGAHNPHIISSPISLEDQSTWESALNPAPRKFPVRSGSTRLSGNAMAGTGLWGSPVSNPGGVKEGTPHSRGSFGTSGGTAPTWGPRSNNHSHRQSWQSSNKSYTATKEEDPS